MRVILLLIFVLLTSGTGISQTPAEKKCEELLILAKACNERLQGDSALALAQKAWRLAKKNNLLFWQARAHGTMSVSYRTIGGNSKKVVDHMHSALRIFKKLKDKKWEAQVYIHLGVYYDYDGNYSEALKNYFQAERIMSAMKDTIGMIEVYGNIGIVYELLDDTTRGLKYYMQALDLSRAIHVNAQIATSLSNLSGLYGSRGELDKMVSYAKQAIEYKMAEKDTQGIARLYNNLGTVFYKQGKEKEAIEYISLAISYREKFPANRELGSSYYNLGYILMEQQKFEEAYAYFKKALVLSTRFNSKQGMYDALLGLTDACDSLRRYEEGMRYIMRFASIQDSIFNVEKTRGSLEMKERFETEKKEKEILIQRERLKTKEAEANRKNTILYTGAGILMLVIALLFLAWRNSKQKQKANQELQLKNAEIHQQKNVIEEKHKEITDSIQYAKRIQTALLTSDAEWEKISPSYMVWLKPKDVVSGDFFWAYTTKSDKGEDIAVWCSADCTGHGVPGAFMSMLGMGFLNEIVGENKITRPNEIMNQLRTRIVRALEQKVGNIQQQDGMDMSLCVWNKKTMNLQFAGANNPLWILRNSEWMEVLADKMPVGRHTNDSQKFTMQEVEIKKGDRIYTFSDGFADQFGGPKGKKYKYSQLKNFLFSQSQVPMVHQKENLEKEFEKWRGDLEQVDDICIIGIEVV